MLAIRDIPLFLNESFIDELWIRIKREGLTKERIQEASSKVAAKAKLGGLGKLWDLLLPEIEAEISGEGTRKDSQKTEINSVLRALLLPELISEIVEISHVGSSDTFDALSQGVFTRILCNNIALTPIPTFASYMRQLVYSGGAPSINSKESQASLETALKMLDSATSSNRALTFHLRTDDEEMGSRALKLLMESGSSEIYNALSLSNDDLYLAASSIEQDDVDTVIFSVLEEQFVKRSLGAFLGNRPVSFFGQVAYFNVLSRESYSRGTNFVGVRAAVVSLC